MAGNAQGTMSRGLEETQIGLGSAPIVLTPHRTRKLSSNTPMALPSLPPSMEVPLASVPISPPVRILIIARPTILDAYGSDTAQADTELIRAFSTQTLGIAEEDMDSRLVQHLITRIARHVWIIFDYGVPGNFEPSVVAFQILDMPTFSTNRCQHPGLEQEVNDTVELWGQRITHGVKFPCRTDLRKNRDARENGKH